MKQESKRIRRVARPADRQVRLEAPSEALHAGAYVTGVVKWWHESKKFGVLETDRPRVATVHCSASAAWAATGREWLKVGTKLRFKVRDFENGNRSAWDIQLVDAEPAVQNKNEAYRSARWRE